jgi:PHP family Zn ribbon phosphoesterase
LGARGIRAVGLSDCVEGSWRTETTQENTQDWLEQDEGDPGFQLLAEEEIAAIIFFIIILSSITYIIKFSVYLFSKFSCLLGVSFAS